MKKRIFAFCLAVVFAQTNVAAEPLKDRLTSSEGLASTETSSFSIPDSSESNTEWKENEETKLSDATTSSERINLEENSLEGSDAKEENSLEGSDTNEENTFLGSDAKEENTLMGNSINDMYQLMDESIVNGQNISFSDVFNSLSSDQGGYQVSQMPQFDMEGSDLSSVDFGSVNLQFAAVATSMQQNYDSMDLSGKSANCLELFQNTYGDVLEEQKLSKPSIPKSFNPNKMLKDSSKSIKKAYQKGTNSGNFATVKKSISLSNVFDEAKKVKAYSTDSQSDLSKKLEKYRSKSKMQSEYDKSNSAKSNFEATKKTLASATKAQKQEDVSSSWLKKNLNSLKGLDNLETKDYKKMTNGMKKVKGPTSANNYVDQLQKDGYIDKEYAENLKKMAKQQYKKAGVKEETTEAKKKKTTKK